MSKSGPKPKAEAERFWAKVDKTTLCWLWTGAVNLGQRGKGGYGKFMVRKINGRGIFEASHRWAYRNCVGPIPPGEDEPGGYLPMHLPPGWYGNPDNPDKPVQWWDGTRLVDRPPRTGP